MDARQEDAFWETIRIFRDTGLLPYVMIIGSWAEYIYSYYFKTDYFPNLRTRDVDILYGNLHKPKTKISIASALVESGYSYVINPSSGVAKFMKEDLLALEFLTRAIGSAAQQFYDIPSIALKAEGLRVINMLQDYPLEVNCHGYEVRVPEPAAYVLQKLLANPTRQPVHKKDKDISAVRALLVHIKKSETEDRRIRIILNELTPKARKIIDDVCKNSLIELI